MIVFSAGEILLLGAGRMGGAMAGRWLEQGLPPEQLVICDPAPSETITRLAANYKVRLQATPEGVSPACIVLAVKPQIMAEALSSLRDCLAANPVIISVAAGVSLAEILTGLGANKLPAVRAMPNLPALIGQGISALWGNAALGAEARKHSEALLGVLGPLRWLEEEAMLNAATAISGSGPAYFFHLVEALARAGEALGLDSQLSLQLAQQTAIGAGALLAQKNADPSALRQQITSPGGTTEAALALLMAELPSLMRRATEAAAARAEALGGKH